MGAGENGGGSGVLVGDGSRPRGQRLDTKSSRTSYNSLACCGRVAGLITSQSLGGCGHWWLRGVGATGGVGGEGSAGNLSGGAAARVRWVESASFTPTIRAQGWAIGLMEDAAPPATTCAHGELSCAPADGASFKMARTSSFSRADSVVSATIASLRVWHWRQLPQILSIAVAPLRAAPGPFAILIKLADLVGLWPLLTPPRWPNHIPHRELVRPSRHQTPGSVGECHRGTIQQANKAVALNTCAR